MNSILFEKYIKDNSERVAKAVSEVLKSSGNPRDFLRNMEGVTEKEQNLIEWADNNEYSARAIVRRNLSKRQKIKLKMRGWI